MHHKLYSYHLWFYFFMYQTPSLVAFLFSCTCIWNSGYVAMLRHHCHLHPPSHHNDTPSSANVTPFMEWHIRDNWGEKVCVITTLIMICTMLKDFCHLIWMPWSNRGSSYFYEPDAGCFAMVFLHLIKYQMLPKPWYNMIQAKVSGLTCIYQLQWRKNDPAGCEHEFNVLCGFHF